MSTARPLFQPEPPPERKPTQLTSPPHRKVSWQRILAWVGSVLAVLLLLSGIAIIFVLNSPQAHRYILAKAQSVASEQLGAQVQLQNFALNFSGLTLDVYGVTVH